MKTSLRPLAALLAAAPVAAFALQDGGFAGPGAQQTPVTAAEAAGLPDDTSVRLVGYIVQSLGDERYEFRDDTGTLVIEIDDDEWHGIEVTPDDRVELLGEIDHEGQEIEIEVESLRLAQ